MELDVVTEVMREACPLEAELMGPTAVAGGSHMNMMDAVSVLSCVAGVAQLALAVWPPKKGIAFVLPTDFDERLRAVLIEHSTTHPELTAALEGPFFERIAGALKTWLTPR
jgi:hypothetical protein